MTRNKLRPKVNKIEIKRTVPQINEIMSCFSEEINKIDKPFPIN